jgi:hypothetical protein
MSSSQIEEYAKYIGLDLRSHPQLRWLAEEGLRCPLPAPWKLIADGATHYFHNTATGKSQWDHPMDDHYKQLAQRMMLQASTPTTQRKHSRASLTLRGGGTIVLLLWRALAMVVVPLRCALQTTFFPRVFMALVVLSAFHYVVYGVVSAVLSVDQLADGSSAIAGVMRYALRHVLGFLMAPTGAAPLTPPGIVDEDDDYL